MDAIRMETGMLLLHAPSHLLLLPPYLSIHWSTELVDADEEFQTEEKRLRGVTNH